MSKQENPHGKREIQCSCGNKFETYIYEFDNPYDYMCPDCTKNDWWRLATRLLKLEKFRCVKCGWKLKKKDSNQCDENTLWFKCKCCGYRFGLFFYEESYY